MTIIHLSDIHLSKDNYIDFINDYKDALICDLILFDKSKKIDVILITGDLVDRGGHSLYEITEYSDKVKYPNPYDIFEEIFINPIVEALNFKRENFLFIPGNHDVDESTILLKEEYDLTLKLDIHNINDYLIQNQNDLRHSKRIKNFKEFEKRFHINNDNYSITNNQSTFYYEYEGFKVGFILVNDSWRCKSIKLEKENDKMFFGVQQLYDGLKQLKIQETKVNIVLFHHSKEKFREEEDIEGFLTRKEVDLLLCGRDHSSKSQYYYNAFGSCHVFRGKASLLKPNETHNDYLPGYQVLELDLAFNKIIQINYRVFNNKPISKSFIPDTTVAENGIDKNRTNGNNGFIFTRIQDLKTEHNSLNIEDFKL